MSIFKRIFRLGKAEVNSAIDKLEDPIKMTEQGIRDMKQDLDKSLKALAEVKALAIRARNDAANFKSAAEDYEKKAMLILQRATKGDMAADEADRLAKEALIKKDDHVQRSAQAAAEQEKFDHSVVNLEKNVKTLRSNISKWENELKILKARVRVSNATKNINKQLAQIDSTDTVSLLERMKEKVAQDEALAESYGEIANESRSVDEEIDKALEGSAEGQADDALSALKAKMGLSEGENQ